MRYSEVKEQQLEQLCERFMVVFNGLDIVDDGASLAYFSGILDTLECELKENYGCYIDIQDDAIYITHKKTLHTYQYPRYHR